MGKFETACHEAGHFVISYRLFPERVRGKIVIRNEDGKAGWYLEEPLWDNCSRRELQNEIVVLYSGYLAQLSMTKASAKVAKLVASDDFETALKYLAWLRKPGERVRLKQRCLAKARRLVRRHQHEILVVALELNLANELSCDEAELIADIASGDAQAQPALDSLRQLQLASFTDSRPG